MALNDETAEIEPAALERLQRADGYLLDGPPPEVPGYVRPLERRGTTHFLTLPISGGDRVTGFICFGQSSERGFEHEDIQQVRRVCDQISVALANARLVDELDRFNWGALRTLARAIDAKSSWTAGHSERVTENALKIGKALALSETELGTLRRGGLLHDIGKIGVPAAILDKPARLTDEEHEVMKGHVLLGAKILEPLEAFKDAMPIVLEHHEWFNGQGYPHGLAGEELTVSGRIYAVADVFDALTSARPYRSGLPLETAVKVIVGRSGTQFDPAIVKVFLEIMATEHCVMVPDGVTVDVDPDKGRYNEDLEHAAVAASA